MSGARRLAVVGLVAALVGGAYVAGHRFVFAPSDTGHLRVAGMIEADEVNLTSRIAGRIVALEVREGDAVTRGQVVCRIDATDVSNQLAKARADLVQARADLENARRMLGRAERLFSEGVASVEARDDAATREAVSSAAVAGAEAQVGYYEDQLRDAAIRSPIDGVVVYEALRIGEWVTPGATILTVDDLSTVWARVDVQETEIGALHVGDSARVTVPGRPPVELPGRIIAISPEGEFAAERDVRRGRQDIRTFFVKVRVEAEASAAKPGMTAEVTFDVGGGPDAAMHGG